MSNRKRALVIVCHANSSVRLKALSGALQISKNDIPLHRVKQEYIKNSLTQLLVLVLIIMWLV